MSEIVRKRVTVEGVVQGVGFRPFVWRRAVGLGLGGWVENDSTGVVIELQGPARSVASFLEGFAAAAPPLARVERIAVEAIPVRGPGDVAGPPFAILASATEARGTTSVPADIATCAACLAELEDPANRRHGYPFTNCTDCGPRYTIIEDLPYDRAATTMRSFAMCDRCAAEYADPADRRFHAQPNACPECGPVVWFAAVGGSAARSQAAAVGAPAITAARSLLQAGRVLALKGIGGFHLACDATNAAAVSMLRERKGRVAKPLAVMVGEVAAARGIALVNEQERRLLEGRERPIVLLHQRRPEDCPGRPLAAEVAPDNPCIGVMLPYAPLHRLLCAGMPPLVMTSGNLSEEPIVSDNEAAAVRLAAIADGFLMHDRPIHVPCDDSVVRCAAGAALPIRRSRGYAPLPIPLAGRGPAVLAAGGELKGAVCGTRDDHAYLSQHIGDLGNVETVAALGCAAEHLLRLFRIEPEAVVADLHPGYVSVAWARRFAAERGLPFVQVQHHEAHVAALLAEQQRWQGDDGGLADGTVAACFDGTGYGHDGTIWGGEFFVVAGGLPRRAAHLEPFALPGGDAAIRHPWRAALAALHAAGVTWDDRLPAVRAADDATLPLVRRQLERGLNTVATSSMGRLFDAVAAIVGTRRTITHEAEAALALEALAGQADADGAYAFEVVPAEAAGGPLRVAWRGVVAAVAADVLAGTSAARIAARFHDAVARMIVDVCTRLHAAGAVGLTGGVFQNALLLERATGALRQAGFEPAFHHLVPPNDGGLALGQAVLARRLIAGRP